MSQISIVGSVLVGLLLVGCDDLDREARFERIRIARYEARVKACRDLGQEPQIEFVLNSPWVTGCTIKPVIVQQLNPNSN